MQQNGLLALGQTQPFLILQVFSQSVLAAAVTENSYRAQNAISLIEEVDAGTIGIFFDKSDSWSD